MNIEHELKYLIDLPAFYAWVQPYVTRGRVSTRVIRQWYVPDKLSCNGVIRVRETMRSTGELEATVLTIKTPTIDPAIRNEFEFVAKVDFNIDHFVNALGLEPYCITKDRWNITLALYNKHPGNKIEVVVDFIKMNGELIGILEIENPPANWVPPDFVIQDVTNNLTFTNYAIAMLPQKS